ncbi:carboxypeptidase regulatory-like domain-containing protein [Egibacter rhizosphaerae]|uniref:Carboxypeptidase regulatory-like domain-containing protein n=1 Tax=Egibacter rhizosphaerae TaxID=1670831 RepID=A0A411YHK9_9ACTN|nr:carboxypeptidase-like regulatory domain-containing protein [Egibacter rhizosphaerae]QBI20730.1 carboxypeptidase regulatory-like domain-containing protein [Egibacter rhizosphaerae]
MAASLLLLAVIGAATVAALTLFTDVSLLPGSDDEEPVPVADDEASDPDEPDAAADAEPEDAEPEDAETAADDEEPSDDEEPDDGLEGLGEPDDAEGEATARGTLRADGDPVGGARVTVFEQDGTEVASTSTDDDGGWELDLPGAGTYDVELDPETLPDGVELDEAQSPTHTVEMADGQGRTVLWRLEATASTPLGEAVTRRLEDEEFPGEQLRVDCPELDRFVAGDLYTCEIVDADPGTDVTSDAVLVSIHDADGEHVALPWTGPGSPPDLDEVVDGAGGSGQFCADVDAPGFGYQEAVAYWHREGQPDRMDASGDGIPCGTVYPPNEIDAYWDAVRTLPDER